MRQTFTTLTIQDGSPKYLEMLFNTMCIKMVGKTLHCKSIVLAGDHVKIVGVPDAEELLETLIDNLLVDVEECVTILE